MKIIGYDEPAKIGQGTLHKLKEEANEDRAAEIRRQYGPGAVKVVGYSPNRKQRRAQAARKRAHAKENKMMKNWGWKKGDSCPECVEGVLGFEPVRDCSCHINPPCSACVDNPLVCNNCGYSPAGEQSDG